MLPVVLVVALLYTGMYMEYTKTQRREKENKNENERIEIGRDH